MLGSVRARTTLAATAVVAVALVAVGVAVVWLLQAELTRNAAVRAEVAAREVATRIAAGTPFGGLDLPDADEQPVQVVDDDGRVRAASEGLRDVTFPTSGEDDDDPVPSTRVVTVDGKAAEYRFAAVRAEAPDGTDVTVHAGVPLDTRREAVGTVREAMLVGLPVLLAVVAAVTWLVTRRALRPVEAIRGELAEITAAGDLARRVPVPRSRDEVARLAATTNATLAALERSVARQRDFVADASHELRSPIASLRAELEVAQAHPELLDVDGLADEVVRLQGLAADLLLLARLDAGDRSASERVALADLVRGAARPGVAMAVEAEPVVLGSRTRLERVVNNLLDNAVRHARSAVRLELTSAGDAAVLRVVDDGSGVAPADRERIFERFVRLDEARSRDAGGAGLGLAIVRDLVEAHGGTVAAREAPGGGAAMEVRLPLARPE
ncbi:HAMP domain-containing sensor histidine kinase [Actinomadura kijaniata]|uniref:histidine kinase n=1 Tax=Actinomadura namibiensis TaxID=182080 RepID=A0A7W3LWP9_ACTNM|nr:ATP-binding protein [Actinomadura namibiensis]MBA8955629.1 signal transduction histidine kinase [Actinomadura namibiensis]